MSFESEWKPALGNSLKKNLKTKDKDKNARLDFGCVLSHGYFYYNQEEKNYKIFNEKQSATSFLFFLISKLQSSATVPMLDIQAYSKWIYNSHKK